jgi:hypothetical protein
VKASSLTIHDSIIYYAVLCVLGALILISIHDNRSWLPSAPGRTLVGSTSLAIIAVCRPLDGDEDAEFLAVQWGTVCHETAVQSVRSKSDKTVALLRP